ncbi:MAG: hypothetical protein DME72_01320 [Verrucomicrobia bacterium]|nr:MAG: hypothetical protein DME72_01320 [Verrucomicrobiota bacterium]
MKENALWRCSILLGLITPVALTDAADDRGNKSRYNLFDPRPEKLLREVTSDRPDQTEGPTKVDAGHCGRNIGITHAADEINAFSGISVRF